MSASYSKDAQFLRDLQNAQKQKKLDQKVLKEIVSLDNKLFFLKEKYESNIASHENGILALNTQINQIKDKIKVQKNKYKQRKNMIIENQKKLNQQIKTESLKRKFEDTDSESDSDLDLDSDTGSVSSSESEDTIQETSVTALSEREKLAVAREAELREQGKPHIDSIIWHEFPDVYQARKEREKEEEEKYKKSPEYLARQAEIEREKEEAKQVKLEIQRQFREADQKVKTALQNIKEAKLKKKSEHEIQGLRLVLQIAENERMVLENKYPYK